MKAKVENVTIGRESIKWVRESSPSPGSSLPYIVMQGELLISLEEVVYEV